MIKRFVMPLVVLLAVAGPAIAEEPEMDARLVGYSAKLNYQAPSASGAWFLLAGLGLVTIGPMFLNAHRTHLD